MAGTKEGGRSARATMVEKHGGEEGYRKFMASIGSKGGKLSTTGGFYADREAARIAGAKGGRNSWRSERRRRKNDN